MLFLPAFIGGQIRHKLEDLSEKRVQAAARPVLQRGALRHRRGKEETLNPQSCKLFLNLHNSDSIGCEATRRLPPRPMPGGWEKRRREAIEASHASPRRGESKERTRAINTPTASACVRWLPSVTSEQASCAWSWRPETVSHLSPHRTKFLFVVFEGLLCGPRARGSDIDSLNGKRVEGRARGKTATTN